MRVPVEKLAMYHHPEHIQLADAGKQWTIETGRRGRWYIVTNWMGDSVRVQKMAGRPDAIGVFNVDLPKKFADHILFWLLLEGHDASPRSR